MIALASFVTSTISPYVAVAAQQAALLIAAMWVTWMVVGRERDE